MSLFAAIADPAANLTSVVRSVPVPAPLSTTPPPLTPIPQPRFAGEPVRWIEAGPTVQLRAFARGAVRVFSTENDIPGAASGMWTLIEIAPLPSFSRDVFHALPGGLPVQYVLTQIPAAAAVNNKLVFAGEPLATTGFFGVCFQDRIVRDAVLWSAQIQNALTATNVDAGDWPGFAQAMTARLADAAGGLPIYILDHVGRPQLSGEFNVSIDGSGTPNFNLNASLDGNTGKTLLSGQTATIQFVTAHPIVAGTDVENGAFEAALTLAPGERQVQVFNAADWFHPRDPTTTGGLLRFHPNSFVEPIVDGTPYFARLVADLRRTKAVAGAAPGGAGLAGWAFIKDDLLDPTLPWSLVPHDKTTELIRLVEELHNGGSNVRFLATQIIQFENQLLEILQPTPLVAIVGLMVLGELNNFKGFKTDLVGFLLCVTGAAVAIQLAVNALTPNLLIKLLEPSSGTVSALQSIPADLVRWTTYPASHRDNPVIGNDLLDFFGVTIRDYIRPGVFHQKLVVIKTQGNPQTSEHIGYLGGIDINSDRDDSPLHRGISRFHDVQARITGPAVKDMIQTYVDRMSVNGIDPAFSPPFDVPAAVPPAGTHLVQIARTYFAPGPSSNGFPFAPQGERLIYNTLLDAIGQARDYIYLEDQYCMPGNEFVDTLVAAADPSRGVRALIITVPSSSTLLFGRIRQTGVFAALKEAWGTRLKIGAPYRRYLNPTPANTANLGRAALKSTLEVNTDANPISVTIGPTARLPKAPFFMYVGSELMLATSVASVPDSNDAIVQVSRGGLTGNPRWGATVRPHAVGSPVLCVSIQGIYVHAKVTMVDDVFCTIGSANMNRRSHFHDGEINAFVVPQHLKRDPENPARLLRCRLWAEHLGITPDMGLALLADPLSAIPYFDRSWHAGNRWQPLSFLDQDLAVDIPVSSSLAFEPLALAYGFSLNAYRHKSWPGLVDPTSQHDPNNDPTPANRGPDFP